MKRANFAGTPSIDVFYLSKKDQELQASLSKDKEKVNFKPKLYRFDYLWSIYGFMKFLEDYNLGKRENIWYGLYKSFESRQEKNN